MTSAEERAPTPAEFITAIWRADGDAETIMRLYAAAIRQAQEEMRTRCARIAEEKRADWPDDPWLQAAFKWHAAAIRKLEVGT